MKATTILALACLAAAVVLFRPVLAQPGNDPNSLPAVLTNSIHYKRAQWVQQRRAHPADRIRDGALLRAWQETVTASEAASVASASVVPGNAWQPIGPAPILNGQTIGSQPVSGRVADLAIDPFNHGHWLAGGAQGGVWETRNEGASWKPLTDDQPSLSMGAIAFSPSNPLIIFAGTGEQDVAPDAYAGVGILKTTNGGTNWVLLGQSTFSGTRFAEIKVHPTDPNLVLAAADSGVWKSTNGGTTWSLKRSGNASDLEPDPTSFTNQYCALGYAYPSSANGIYRSTDMGETWTRIGGPWSAVAGGVGRIELAIAPSARDILYVSVQDAIDGSARDGRSLGIWSTDTAWAAAPGWSQLPGVPSSSTLWYNHDLVVNPANPNILYFGENNMWKFDGDFWIDITGTTHIFVQTLAWAGSRLVLGSDGGVWSTVDGGTTWSDHNTNLELTEFYHGAVSPNDANFALGGELSNGSSRWFGANSWLLVSGGNGCGCAIANASRWAVSQNYQAIRRTRDNGTTFEDANNGLTGSRPLVGKILKAPHNDDIFLAGTSVLNKSTNFFSAPTATWLGNSPSLGSSVDDFAFAPSDPTDQTYAYSAGSALRLTLDGGATWKDLDPSGEVPGRTITGLAFNPTNANLLYVCLSGFNETTPDEPGHVFKTANALAPSPTWTLASYSVNVPAHAMVLDRTDPNVLYVATDLGVWRSRTAGASWTHMGPELGMPNVAVFDLAIENTTSRLIAFTHGRGAFALIPANTADLALTQTDQADPHPLVCPLVYTLSVLNRGPSDATGVFVTNCFPVGTSFSAATASQGTFTQSGSSLVFRLGTLPVSSNATLTVTIVPVGVGFLTNSAQVTANQLDPDPSNNTNSETTTVVLDLDAPEVLSAVAQPEADSILVTFSEAVALETATDPANYMLLDGRSNVVELTSLERGPTPGTVVLGVAVLAHPGPFTLNVGNITDCSGNLIAAGTVAYVSQSRFILAPAGAAWKYLDNGIDQGTAWRALDFNDSSWNTGHAQFGYGEGDEQTVLDFGPNANAKYPTYYFRHAFVIPNAALVTNLAISLLRDDGGVVYLNGTEVYRNNMPAGSAGFSTLASTNVNGPDENRFFVSGVIHSNLLVTGTNVLAVEIHQNSGTSPDVSFDLSLSATLKLVLDRPSFLEQPDGVTALVGDTVTFSIIPGGTPPFGYQWRRGNVLVMNFPGAPVLTLTNVQLSDAGTYSCILSNLLLPGVRSAFVPLNVFADSDGDRMPDTWEQANGFALDDRSDAARDADGDGQSNLQEYLAGTDPNDPQSYFKIEQITTGSNRVSLQFFAASNHTYSVQYRNAIGGAAWSNLAVIPYFPSNRIETILDTSSTAGERFYRLVAPRQP